MQQRIQLLRLYLEDRLLLRELTFLDQIDRDLKGSRRGSLTISGLKHEQLAAFDGELHVLHVRIVIFQRLRDFNKLIIYFRKRLMQRGDRLRRADTRNDIFALCIHQVFAVQSLFARRRVSRKRDARAAVVAHVAEDHGLNIDGRAPAARDVVQTAIYDGSRVVPGTENGLDRFDELFLRILREFHAHFLLIELFIFHNDLLEVLCIQLGVQLYALRFLRFVQDRFELGLLDAHNDIREHLNETAIAVVCKAGVLRLRSHALYGDIVKTQVQDGIHHARHGSSRAGTNRYQERVFRIAKLLSGDFFGLRDRGVNLFDDVVRNRLAVFVVLRAGFGRDRETLRHRQTDLGHLCQVRTFTAQQVPHRRVAFAEHVNILTHCNSSLCVLNS